MFTGIKRWQDLKQKLMKILTIICFKLKLKTSVDKSKMYKMYKVKLNAKAL